MKKSLIALALFSTTSVPVLAESVNLEVTGSIQSSACNISLPDGPTVDYGNIDNSLLDKEEYTVLEMKKITLTMSCDAPTKVSLSAENGQPGTMALPEGATESAEGVGVAPVELLSRLIGGVGLGLSGGKKTGGYTMIMPKGKVIADGKLVEVVGKLSAETDWKQDSSGAFYTTRGKKYLSFADGGTVTPIAIKNVSAEIFMQAYLNKQSELNVLDEVTLAGQTTVEVSYL